jgi:hypothetical protein
LLLLLLLQQLRAPNASQWISTPFTTRADAVRIVRSLRIFLGDFHIGDANFYHFYVAPRTTNATPIYTPALKHNTQGNLNLSWFG